MQVFVDNKLTALKKGSSIEYISENRMFSGSDGYTLTITFPLKGCRQNIDVFGHINRDDVIARKVVFKCEIRDRRFVKVGSITITEISNDEVKAQFLEGRSEQNFDKTFDKVYINELTLGYPDITSPDYILPWQAWSPNFRDNESVALPWWNDSDNGLSHNFAEYRNGAYSWTDSVKHLTWQPYLLFITKKICEAVGYSFDFSVWEESEELKYILVCNTLPEAWDINDYARALPHWTVSEFFEKLELFLGGEFDIDHRAKHFSFGFTEDILSAIPPVRIDRIVDEHTVEVDIDEEKCEYQEAKNLVYKDCDNDMWKFYSCDWFIRQMQEYTVTYSHLSDLIEANKWLASWNGSTARGTNINKLLYAEDIDMYFIIRTVGRSDNGKDSFGNQRYIYKCILQPVNVFGGRIVDDSEDADELEIEFSPVKIDHTEEKYGYCMFLSFDGYNEDDSSDGSSIKGTPTQAMLMAGEKERKAEYFDTIYVGYWDGGMQPGGKLPYPYVSDVVIRDDWSGYFRPHFSFRLNDKYSERRKILHRINKEKKANFKFISDVLPDPRAVFFIKGKRYLCEKITVTFTESGMSQLLKGVFYQLDE